MSYLLDKKSKIKKNKKVAIIVIAFIFLFYFRVGVLSGASTVVHFVFRPVLILGNNIGNGFGSMGAYFNSKKLLTLENENLKAEILASGADRANYSAVVEENNKLKEILGRKGEKINLILASILSKPNRSPYDTLIVDIGVKDGAYVGQKVFALGNIPIGKIAEIYESTSKVVLFSSPLEKTDVVVVGQPARNAEGITSAGGNTLMQLIGRGGGNFEMILPRDFIIEKGTEVVLPGITSQVVGVVETILSDPRDSYQKALLQSPVNIFQLKFVGVEK